MNLNIVVFLVLMTSLFGACNYKEPAEPKHIHVDLEKVNIDLEKWIAENEVFIESTALLVPMGPEKLAMGGELNEAGESAEQVLADRQRECLRNETKFDSLGDMSGYSVIQRDFTHQHEDLGLGHSTLSKVDTILEDVVIESGKRASVTMTSKKDKNPEESFASIEILVAKDRVVIEGFQEEVSVDCSGDQQSSPVREYRFATLTLEDGSKVNGIHKTIKTSFKNYECVLTEVQSSKVVGHYKAEGVVKEKTHEFIAETAINLNHSICAGASLFYNYKSVISEEGKLLSVHKTEVLELSPQ